MDSLTRIAHDLLGLADFGYGRLRSRLRGLTDEEYWWEPASGCWSGRLAADGWHWLDGSRMPPRPAPLTTIAWRLCHLIGGLIEGDRFTPHFCWSPDMIGNAGNCDASIAGGA